MQDSQFISSVTVVEEGMVLLELLVRHSSTEWRWWRVRLDRSRELFTTSPGRWLCLDSTGRSSINHWMVGGGRPREREREIVKATVRKLVLIVRGNWVEWLLSPFRLRVMRDWLVTWYHLFRNYLINWWTLFSWIQYIGSAVTRNWTYPRLRTSFSSSGISLW